jgi:hypothetical protein
VGFMEQSQVLEVMEMQAEMIRSPTKYLHVQSTEQCLASSKLLTSHPPLHPASVSFLRTKGGEVQTRRAVGGVGGQYFGRRQTLDWPLTV